MANRPAADFCVEALNGAIHTFGAPEIMNTEQGSQFTSFAWTDWLTRVGPPRTRSTEKERSCDNFFIERLGWSLKQECVYRHAWETGAHARVGIIRWITFSTPQRPGAAFGRQPLAVSCNSIGPDQQVQTAA